MFGEWYISKKRLSWWFTGGDQKCLIGEATESLEFAMDSLKKSFLSAAHEVVQAGGVGKVLS